MFTLEVKGFIRAITEDRLKYGCRRGEGSGLDIIRIRSTILFQLISANITFRPKSVPVFLLDAVLSHNVLVNFDSQAGSGGYLNLSVLNLEYFT